MKPYGESYKSNRDTNGLVPFKFGIIHEDADRVSVECNGTIASLSMEQYHVLEAMFRGMRARMEDRNDA